MPEPLTPLVERPWEDVERMLDVDVPHWSASSAFSPLQRVTSPLPDAADMVLAADVIAVNVPPFRNSGHGWLCGAGGGYALPHGRRRRSFRSPRTWPRAARCASAWRRRGNPDHDRAPLPMEPTRRCSFEETDATRLAHRGAVLVYRARITLAEDIVTGTCVACRGQRRGRQTSGRSLLLVSRASETSSRWGSSTGNEVTSPGDRLQPGAICAVTHSSYACSLLGC